MSIATHLTRAAHFLHAGYDPATGTLEGATITERRLSDLHGVFADERAYERAVADGDPIVYTVQSLEPGDSDGDLHYGIGTILPGRIGEEYYMTKGHLHFWRPAAEVYVGLRGTGAMLLEDEETGESRLVPLGSGQIVYVPGHTAHRTINSGADPLVYIGIFSARAGHDYSSIAAKNFRHVVVADGDGVAMRAR
jgi:glucose-6-phosphate isomerase, archaeal